MKDSRYILEVTWSLQTNERWLSGRPDPGGFEARRWRCGFHVSVAGAGGQARGGHNSPRRMFPDRLASRKKPGKLSDSAESATMRSFTVQTERLPLFMGSSCSLRRSPDSSINNTCLTTLAASSSSSSSSSLRELAG